MRDYFRSEDFVEDINEDNVLGTGGAAAWAFHRLLEQLWNGKNSAVKPSEVKVGFKIFKQFLSIFFIQKVVGERAPQFQGYSQHDAQEFCAYILDLLHEDVNQARLSARNTFSNFSGLKLIFEAKKIRQKFYQ